MSTFMELLCESTDSTKQTQDPSGKYLKKKCVAMETRTRQTLTNETSNDDGWLIVIGTYGSWTLPDKDGKQRPLFLDPPSRIPVPLFYWELVHNTRTKNGIVYMSLNNPYKEIDDSQYLCPNTYLGDYDNAGAGMNANESLVHCCTKKSFKEFYGELDPIVYSSENFRFWA